MMKKLRKKSGPSESRKFGVVLEHIDSKLDHIVEGQHGLQEQIRVVDGKVEDLRGEMNYKFDVVFEELHVIRDDLKEKVSRDEFVVLEKRVLHLEKKVSHSGR